MIHLLGSGIGRGHAFYLDGLEQALAATAGGPAVARTDVFAVSRGASRLAWDAAHAAYRLAGRGGLVAAAYGLLRGDSDYNRPSLALRILGRDLGRWWSAQRGLLVVDHPATVGALAANGTRDDVWYMHGEMVAPPEAIVRGATCVLVPLEETAEAFVRGGVPRERVLVTGVCVDRALVGGAAEWTAARRARLGGDGPLTVAFFSSGAEPAAHVATLAAGACALARDGRHRALVFAARGGRLAAAVRHAAGGGAVPEVVTFGDRADLDRRTAEAFPAIDVVASPPHERSNWAVALGVPFLLVGPDLGPFAPRNRALLRARKVAVEMESKLRALALPARLDHLRRDGELLAMSLRGTEPDLGGFAAAARHVAAAAAAADMRGAGP